MPASIHALAPTRDGSGKVAYGRSIPPAPPKDRPRPERPFTYRILIASSNAQERSLWWGALAAGGCVLSTTDDPQIVLRHVRGGEADLIVAALTMEGMDALELLREAQKVTVVTPIAVVAGGATRIDHLFLRYAGQLGAAATFTQPIAPNDFAAAIRAVLQIRSFGP